MIVVVDVVFESVGDRLMGGVVGVEDLGSCVREYDYMVVLVK